MFGGLVMEGAMIREVRVILTLYLGTLLGGFSVGFSSSALPGIREEWDINNAGAKLVLTKATELEIIYQRSTLGGAYQLKGY